MKKRNKTNCELNLFVPEKRRHVVSRPVRFATSIKRIIADTIMKNDFPVDKYNDYVSRSTIITVTHVDVTEDLRNVMIYVSPLDISISEKLIAFYNSQKYYFKEILSKKANMRYVPELHFKLDRSAEEAQRIEFLLENCK